MNIENEVFKKAKINLEKLIKYGFTKKENQFVFEKEFFNNFKAIIIFDGKIKGTIIDLETNDEYTNIRTNMDGKFVNKIRDEYKKILIDIRNSCSDSEYFLTEQANRNNNYIKNKYKNNPEFLWDKFPDYGIFRNPNNKWYAIIMNIDFSKIDKKSGEIEIINVKLNRKKIETLLKKEGYYPAYHMSKKDWISVVLNDNLSDCEIFDLIDESYNLVGGRK